MHILLVADGRSPITKRWLQGLLALQHRVTLMSTFPCEELPGLEGMQYLPVAFGGMAGSQVKKIKNAAPKGGLRRAVSRFRSMFLAGRYYFGTGTLPFYTGRYQSLLKEIKPDLVHAMRIPFEGMLAASTPSDIPLAVSIWGNDLTLHGFGSPAMTAATRKVLNRADGLLADAQRDIRLAHQWGFDFIKPSLVIPGGGGIDLSQIYVQAPHDFDWMVTRIPAGCPLVINPRGFRPGSVRNDTFFNAIPHVLKKIPNAYFICPSMAGQEEAENWIARLKIGEHVLLLPYLDQPLLWELFKRANVSVSISIHDGTPNSLLEAMACGCFPIAGDIESIREWIVPGINGLVVEPGDPELLAEGLVLALKNPGLRKSAAEYNQRLICERAEVSYVRAQLQVFYQRLLTK